MLDTTEKKYSPLIPQDMTDELSKEKDAQKQQEMLKSINLLIETIAKLKD